MKFQDDILRHDYPIGNYIQKKEGSIYICNLKIQGDILQYDHPISHWIQN